MRIPKSIENGIAVAFEIDGTRRQTGDDVIGDVRVGEVPDLGLTVQSMLEIKQYQYERVVPPEPLVADFSPWNSRPPIGSLQNLHQQIH